MNSIRSEITTASPPQSAVRAATFEQGIAAGELARSTAVFVLLAAGYALAFSYDSGDALDTARWMQTGEIVRLVEFRHLVQRLLPMWLWLALGWAGLSVDALFLLRAWDVATAAASVMLLYVLLGEFTRSRVARFGACFLFATSHCVWGYAGSGRLYSTSMLLAIGAYYLALHVPRLQGARRWLAAASAATYVCFAALFWLVHIFNAVGVGLLLLLQPMDGTWRRRVGLTAVFGFAGIAVALAVGVSALIYGGVPLTGPAVQAWITDVKTPPTSVDWTSPMKAAFGQAHGILAQPDLPYMINGLIRKDPELTRIGSLPWQLSKFVFICILLVLVYVYPFALLKKADARMRAVILALLAPLLINLYFALTWLGTDRQRFLPSMISIVALGMMSALDLAKRTRKPRLVAVFLSACLVFIAGVNFVEVILPSQRLYIALEAEFGQLKRVLRWTDLTVDFGKDIRYHAAILNYSGAPYLTLSNDASYYDWDSPDWQERFRGAVEEVWQRGGRVFVMDRLALGAYPLEAAWSEKQHPRPTVKEFSQYLRANWCVEPAFHARFRYFQLTPRQDGCTAAALPPTSEGGL